ncbi:MAG: metallopeptidase TldD-related protein [Nocardioides sp.]
MTPASPATPQDLVEYGLARARSGDCIVIAARRSSANIRWANNTLTTNGLMATSWVTVIAFEYRAGGVAAASVSGSASTLDQVALLIDDAEAAVRSASFAEDAAPLLEGQSDPAWEDEPVPTDIAVYADLAPRLGAAFENAGSGRRLLYGFVDHQITTTYLGSSRGLRRRHVQPSGYLTCTAKTADLGHSAWIGRATPDFTDVDPVEVERNLASRLGWAARSVSLPAARYPTILTSDAVADLAIYAYWVADARSAHDGQSVYGRPGGGTRIGEPVASTRVRMWSDPGRADLPTAPFALAPASGLATSVFDNGLPLEETSWIDQGVLRSLVHTRYTAELTGHEATPAIGNLLLETGGTGNIEDLVARTDHGLLVTCLWYIREVDPQSLLLTGLTRDGVYLVEGGEVTGEVNNFRFNESPLGILSRFDDSSSPTKSFSREWGEEFPWVSMPALRVPDFHMSSVSQAQ